MLGFSYDDNCSAKSYGKLKIIYITHQLFTKLELASGDYQGLYFVSTNLFAMQETTRNCTARSTLICKLVP